LQRLGSILAQLRLPGPGPVELRLLESALEAALSAKVPVKFQQSAAGRANARVASYRRGRLVVEVKSAARAFELQAFARPALVERLKRQPGLEQLAEVVFRNGSWRANGQQ